ncbi:MAG: zinc ribbon domain-containing protein [Oscillospiraceae bacterium]|nr:zinc ribbon domain-containing protein [Oscillospiraceae bacterium]
MKLFEDLMNKAEKFADQAVKVSKEAFDQTKVMAGEAMDKGQKKMKELSLESDMKDGYRKLGELVYKMEKNGTTDDGLKAQYIAELAALEAEIEALKNSDVNEEVDFTVEDVKAEIKEEATEIVEEIKEVVEEVKEAVMGEAEEVRVCPSCGAAADDDDVFCHDCGGKLN